MTAGRYPWIPTRRAAVRSDARRGYRDGRAPRRLPDPCQVCGYDPIGRRKKCPACLAPTAEMCRADGGFCPRLPWCRVRCEEGKPMEGHADAQTVLLILACLVVLVILLRMLGVQV